MRDRLGGARAVAGFVVGAVAGGVSGALAAERRSRRTAVAARLETRRREAEQERLQAQLVTAEQDERRRLALFLHDGPLQSLAGIALMHDAALAALAEGRHEDAVRILESTSARERETMQALRDLSFAIEPVVLRDRGLAAALRELADQIERAQDIRVTLDLGSAASLGESARVAIYQTVREALSQAVRRRPVRISVAIERRDDGSVVAVVSDDGMGERRRAAVDAIAERAAVAGGRTAVEPAAGGGTVVLVSFPPHAAAV